MPRFEKSTLLQDLSDRNRQFGSGVTALASDLTAGQLSWKPDASTWSIAQVMDHLVKSHKAYLEQSHAVLAQAQPDSSTEYKPGWFGNLLYNKLQPPAEGAVKPLPAPAFLRPDADSLDVRQAQADLLAQVEELDQLISLANTANIRKLKIPFSVSKLLKIPVGDVLRFVVAHNDRHFLQMQRVKNQLNTVNPV